jgi:hypothetical protein
MKEPKVFLFTSKHIGSSYTRAKLARGLILG